MNKDDIQEIIDLHDKYFKKLPIDSKSLYVSEDAMMWDGYIESVVQLNDIIDSTFRYNKNIMQVDISEAYKPSGIENLNINEIGFLFRDILVNEKFHLGLFVGVIVDGRISRLVNRLKVLINTL